MLDEITLGFSKTFGLEVSFGVPLIENGNEVLGNRHPEVIDAGLFIFERYSHSAHLYHHFVQIDGYTKIPYRPYIQSPAFRGALRKPGGERDSLAPSMALALRAACGCAKRLSCRFVEPCHSASHPF